MNKWQKIAWYNIIVILVTLSVTALAVGILAMKYGFPIARSGLGFLGTLGLLGLSNIVIRQKKGRVEFDERDKLIFYRSIQITYAVFWPVFTAACMIPWAIVGPKNSISSNTLPLMLGAIGVSMVLVQSLVTLIQYGRENKGEKL